MKSFIDSGVLILAFRAEGKVGRTAIQILDDQNREFASSWFVKLELLPKAIYHQQPREAEFYQSFFDSVQFWENNVEQVVQDGYRIACQYGLAALDALHIAAALSVGAEEFVTTERLIKPMHRVTELRVVSIVD